MWREFESLRGYRLEQVLKDKMAESYRTQAAKEAVKQTSFSQANISGHKVGAAVLAYPSKGLIRYGLPNVFGGCNIELAAGGLNLHAEKVAVAKAISEGCPYVTHLFVTSTHPEQRAALCGYCLQDMMYVNPDCLVTVLGVDGKELFTVTVRERNGEYGYKGTGAMKLWES